MRGPIDFIVVSFEGNKFDGSILKALAKATEQGVIDVLDVAIVQKYAEGNVMKVNVANLEDETQVFISENKKSDVAIADEDIDEVGDLLEPNTAAGLLIIEQLWAKTLKQAILAAHGSLVAEGRIHPEAVMELSK